MSPASDIAEYLDDALIGTKGTDIFANAEPSGPNACITVIDTSGRDMAAYDIELRRPGIQIRVRNLSYEAAYTVAESIIQALCYDQTSFTVNSHRYIGAWLSGDLINMGRDENDRYILSLNFLLDRQPIEGAS